MTTQDLITQWTAQAVKLREEAETKRRNGMFESARGMRLKADQLTDCAAELQRLTPPISATPGSPGN